MRRVQLQDNIDKNGRESLSGECKIARASDKASKVLVYLVQRVPTTEGYSVPMGWAGVLDVHPIYWSDALATD